MQRANCINLVAFWIVALSQQAMKPVKHRKLCCYCLLAWGASVSALCFCCFLAHRLLYGIFVICCSLLFYFAIPIPGVIQCYHLFWYVSDDYELTSWSPTVLFLGCVLFCSWFVCVGFVCFCLVLLVWFVLVECPRTVTAQRIMHRSYSVLLLVHIVDIMMLPLH